MSDADAPPGPHPADPTKPCPFASLPDDLWEHVSAYLIDTNSTDFVVCTSTTVNDNQKLPLSPLNGLTGIDHIVRGIPCNGDLYLLEVPPEPEAFMGEHKVRDSAVPGPPFHGPVGNAHARFYKDATDNGEWYSHIQRDDGEVDEEATPTYMAEAPWLIAGRHRFFKDTDGTVMLHTGQEEMNVVQERHRCDEIEITSANAYGQIHVFHSDLRDRWGAVIADTRFRYMPIPHAHAGEQTGKLTLMSLCKGLTIRAKITIKGKLPMLTRLAVWNPDDEYANMTHPFNLKSQMGYTHDKWLALVPLKWIVAQQSSVHKDLEAMNPKTEPIPTREELYERRVASNSNARTCAILEHSLHSVSGKCEYIDTSFEVIARAMVYAFFSMQSRFVNLFSDKETIEMLYHAKHKPMFKIEFGLSGPHVIPAKAGESLRVSKSSRSASAFNAPELDLLGEFAGVF